MLFVDAWSVSKNALFLLRLVVKLNDKHVPTTPCPENVLSKVVAVDLVICGQLERLEGLQTHGIYYEKCATLQHQAKGILATYDENIHVQ